MCGPPARLSTGLGRQRGLALLSVLWVVTLLSLIAASFTVSTRTEINVAYNQAENARAEALADAGVYRAIMGLMSTDPKQSWRADGTVYAWRYAGGELRAAVRDEGGKIDLNHAQDELLTELFVAAGLDGTDAAALADAIVDFRDEDDLRRVNGAEDLDYEDAGLPYGAKDAPFESIEELRQVLGMSPSLFEEVAPAFTVYARQRRPHEPTAPPLVKEALVGRSAADAEQKDDDGEPGLAAPSTGSELSDEPPELTETPQSLGPVTALPRSRARVFSVHVEGRLDSGAVFARDAIVRLAGGGPLGFEFRLWRQGRRELFVDEVVGE